MGGGFHGGFGNTQGMKKSNPIAADSTLVGKGVGEKLRQVAEYIAKVPGYTDVVVHGDAKEVAFMKDGKWEKLSHRSLAKYLKSDSGYQKGNVRLISCSTGKDARGFAQNLANKMGVVVRAPSDTLYVYPSGKMVIGPDPFHNTGKWVDYYPERNRKK